MLLVQQQYVLNTHSTVSAYVLAVASSCTCFAAGIIYKYSNNQQQQQFSSRSIANLFRQDQILYIVLYRMEEIKSLLFHIMFYRLFRGVAKYIAYGNTFSSFEWLRSLYAAHHERREGETERPARTKPKEGLHL